MFFRVPFTFGICMFFHNFCTTSGPPVGCGNLRFSDLRVYATDRFTASSSGDGGMVSWLVVFFLMLMSGIIQIWYPFFFGIKLDANKIYAKFQCFFGLKSAWSLGWESTMTPGCGWVPFFETASYWLGETRELASFLSLTSRDIPMCNTCVWRTPYI